MTELQQERLSGPTPWLALFLLPQPEPLEQDMRTGFRYERDGSATYFLHGKRVSKRVFDAAIPSKPILGGAAYALAPALGEKYRRGRVLHSISVTPAKAAELRAFYKQRGVAATVDNDGMVYVHSKKAERAACESRGFYNRNGGYSDARQGVHADRRHREEVTPNSEANRALQALMEPMRT